MERDDISELHFICPIPNVVSILDHGIVSHTKAKRLSHESIADPEVQERRSKVKVPNGMKLHDYANLYFNGRNSMMSAVVKPGGSDGICLLRVDLNVLDLPDVVITDCNAASNYVRFFDLDVGFQNIDHDEIFSVSWNHSDYFTRTRHGSRMCAEVLVPDRVDPSLILGAYVGSPIAFASLVAVAPSLNVAVDTARFFA